MREACSPSLLVFSEKERKREIQKKRGVRETDCMKETWVLRGPLFKLSL